MDTTQKLTGNELMSYNAGSLSAGTSQLGSINTLSGYGQCYDTFHYYYPQWYPSYHYCEKSKIEQAFKIVGKLLEKDIIEKELTVKQFMKLVNEIAEVL